MNDIAFGKQKARQIRAVLASHACDKSSFLSQLKVRCRVTKTRLLSLGMHRLKYARCVFARICLSYSEKELTDRVGIDLSYNMFMHESPYHRLRFPRHDLRTGKSFFFMTQKLTIWAYSLTA